MAEYVTPMELKTFNGVMEKKITSPSWREAIISKIHALNL